MQETKCKIAGSLKLDGFIVYEHTRANGEGGGLALCVKKELNPAFLMDGGPEVEAMTVDIHVRQMTISCSTAYGPQENDNLQKKHLFWDYLTEVAVEVKKEGKGFLLQGDMNAWLGSKIIKGDNREQNRNGKLFEAFLNINNLTVVNSLPLCKGVITRQRMRQGKLVKSVLDFYVVCQCVLASVVEMKIDNDRKHILTNFSKVKKGGSVVDSDHMTTILKVNLNVIPEKPKSMVMYNFRDPKGQNTFKTNTTNTTDFSKCFMTDSTVDCQADNWMKLLMTHCAMAFPKIGIRSKNLRKSLASDLIDRRNKIIQNKSDNKKEVECLTVRIAEILAEESKSKAYEFRKFCDKDNTLNLTEMWKMKKKLWPKKRNHLPMAKRNHQGKIVSAPSDLRKLLLKEYKERLRPRPYHPKLKVTQKIRKKVINLKLKIAMRQKSQPFKMEELEEVLKGLSSGKARDSSGISREIFKQSHIGSDLKRSLLLLFNKI